MRAACGDGAGGKVHLAHQPAAEDIACRIGVCRHSDDPDRRDLFGLSQYGQIAHDPTMTA